MVITGIVGFHKRQCYGHFADYLIGVAVQKGTYGVAVIKSYGWHGRNRKSEKIYEYL